MKLVHGDICAFIKMAAGKKIVCFGAGQVLRNFINENLDYCLEDDIYCIVDNDKKKTGKTIRFGDAEIPVIGVDQLLTQQNVLILITCAAAYDIFEQLDAYEELKDTYCWVANFIRSETNFRLDGLKKYPSDLRLEREQLIPKKIHYCWFGKNPLPQRYKEWMESWRKYCPDYEFIRWDEDNYDVTKNPYMFEAYKAGKWAFASDYARLDIIYDQGGIYLDTDVELLKNLDELLYQKAFLGIDASRRITLGLGFGARPGCKMIKELMDIYNAKEFIKKDGNCDLTVAPEMQRAFFREKGYIENGEFQMIDDVTVYPEKVLSARCGYTGRMLSTEHSFAAHHNDGSWASEAKKRNVLNNQGLFRKAVMLE